MLELRQIRTQVFYGVVGLAAACFALGFWRGWVWWAMVLLGPLVLVGIWDLTQTRHSLLRNYPLVGHLRFLIEGTGAELRQYIVESNTEGRPFNRDTRSLMYQRAKNLEDKKPFGTELDLYAETYGWLAHSMAPKAVDPEPVANFRVEVGGPDCAHPYSASTLNISAMSFGSLSAHAIRALNLGASKGDFAHNTGEGGFSPYHREGGDVIWQIGTGYFGCRGADGGFDEALFSDQAAHDAIRMIEIKISQGAKPGHGGILPGHKVTPEIAAARRIAVGRECVSPPYHRAFSTPLELCGFVGRLRELSGGKPVGFKLCIGRPEEFFGVIKAILETEIAPDYIAVDGAEGGTGAAPIEFSDHIGMPVKESISFVRNALVGAGLRDTVRIAAAGKLVTAFDISLAHALGADFCCSARGFMFALGCIQAQACHTNGCPVGVATQDDRLQRALVVDDKAERVLHFHKNTVHAVAEVIAAAGLSHPRDLKPRMLFQRISPTDIRSLDALYDRFKPGQLLDGDAGEMMQGYWDAGSPERF